MHSLFEGMDTPDGFLPGIGSWFSAGAAFFPMAPTLRQVILPAAGWSPVECAVLTGFACMSLKTVMHAFARDLALDLQAAKVCAAVWVFALWMHYVSISEPSLQQGAHDPVALFVYAALFVLPTFVFTGLQIRSVTTAGK